MEPKKIIDAVTLVIVAYSIYSQVTGDHDLKRLRVHAEYHAKALRRDFRRFIEPAWRDELRKYNDENYTIPLPNPELETDG